MSNVSSRVEPSGIWAIWMLTNMLTQSIMLQKKIVSRLIRVAVKTKNGKQEQRMRQREWAVS